jgi:uncharacterized protein (DUF302 family)
MRYLLAITALLLSASASAGDLLVTGSPDDVPTTVARLEKAIESKGLKLFSRIDHSAGARRAGMALAPNQVLIFGNPKIGTLLMQQNPAIGGDLPLRISVWRDAQGQTRIGYRDIQAVAATYAIDPQLPVVQKVRGALAALASEAAGQQ